jgi:ABC-type uncharacterized transport system YnjBCD substrate-binding protein
MKHVWLEIMDHVRENYKETKGEWRYYNDCKQWLFKMQQKSRTLFWIAILEGTFRITFYFGDKAENMIEKSELPEIIKHYFRTGKRYGSIRPVSIKISGLHDIDSVIKLIEIKSKLK